MSALSIPPWSEKIFKKLEGYYEAMIISPVIAKQIIKELIQPDLPGFSLEDIMLAFEKLKMSKQGEKKKSQRDIYHDEYLALTKKQVSGGTHTVWDKNSPTVEVELF